LKINVKNISNVNDLASRVNTALKTLQSKFPNLKNEKPAAEIVTGSIKDMLNFVQPAKCETFISPRILRILGIRIAQPWIMDVKVEGIYKTGLDKFLQTLWIYSDIIQAQFVGDTLAHVLRIIPIKSKKSDNDTIGMVFDTPIFCKLSKDILSTVDILITSSEGTAPVDFGDNEVIIGLIFKKCDQF